MTKPSSGLNGKTAFQHRFFTAPFTDVNHCSLLMGRDHSDNRLVYVSNQHFLKHLYTHIDYVVVYITSM